MASTEAIQAVERILQRTDKQTRDILATYQGGIEVDTINVVVGDGTTVLTTGVISAVRVDFESRITGAFIHEVDGITGSVSVDIAKAQYAAGITPVFVSIVASSPLTVASARYGQNLTLPGWTVYIARGDVLRFSITSVSAFTRLLVALRVRRLEPSNTRSG